MAVAVPPSDATSQWLQTQSMYPSLSCLQCSTSRATPRKGKDQTTGRTKGTQMQMQSQPQSRKSNSGEKLQDHGQGKLTSLACVAILCVLATREICIDKVLPFRWLWDIFPHARAIL